MATVVMAVPRFVVGGNVGDNGRYGPNIYQSTTDSLSDR